ncbi:hypothetical protein M0R72_21150 [Candidatus Pacearchaeota archaeon]|jgi:hypothetical protein|nr:hypothetical protein [Candidatus Pacearchaeota archaeon]
MLEIVDLLEKLKQLDPATWKEFSDDMGSIVCDGGCDEPTEIYFTHDNCWTHVSEAWLQFCIQRACEQKEWDWYVEGLACPGERLPYLALVECNPAWQCDGHSSAEALLGAYIACLESHP